MLQFSSFLKEEEEAQQLKHIHHAEDRPLMHGHEGFEHAHGALTQAHEHMKAGKHNTNLTMKYDGSPSVVFGHHPKSGKFFVASKSAFNKNPKINHTDADIDKNHGHAPGLAEKLKAALHHLPKVTPKTGVYQGDLMHSGGSKSDVHHDAKTGSAKFTPNTITYTAHGDEAKKAAQSKVGVVVHQKYEHAGASKELHHMSATPHPDAQHFGQHKDVHLKFAEHDTSKINYDQKSQDTFHKHMNAAKAIHDTHGSKMYSAIHPQHSGEGGHLTTYINSTVRKDEVPTAKGFQEHLKDVHAKAASKLKSEAGQNKKTAEGAAHVEHVEKNKSHYDNLFAMHQHLQKAKDTLVHNLNKHTGGLEHHIDHAKTDPEGFVVNHSHAGKPSEPTKLVNRAEFSKANLLKIKKWNQK
jgi:hypothetical protein